MNQTSARPSRFSLSRISERTVNILIFVIFFIAAPGVFISSIRASIDYIVGQGETRYIEMDVDQARGLVDSQLDQLDRTLLDWSAWDDTYQFAQDLNQNYIDEIINPEAIANIGVDYFILTDAAGNLIYTKTLDPVTGEEAPPPFDIQALLARYPRLAMHNTEDSQYGGLGVAGDQILLLVSRPVLTSQYTGPIPGSLIFGRLLGDEEVAALAALAQRDIRIFLPVSDGWPALPAEGLQALRQGGGTYVTPVDRSKISGYHLLEDMNGEAAILLELTGPRELYQQGQQAGLLVTFTVAMTGALLFFIARPLAIARLRAYKKERAQLEQARLILEQMGEAVVLVAGDGSVLEMNPPARSLLQVPDTANQPLHLTGLLCLETGEALPPLAQLAAGEPVELRCRLPFDIHQMVRSSDPQPAERSLLLEIAVRSIRLPEGSAYSLVLRDSARRNQALRELREAQERADLATRGANEGLWDWDLAGHSLYLSPGWKALLGYAPSEIGSDPDEWLKRIHPNDQAAFKTRLAEHVNGGPEAFDCEHRLLHKDGRYRWMHARGSAVLDRGGAARRITGLLADISERKKNEELLRRTALQDPVTGLANRALLLDRLQHANERKKRNDAVIFAVYFLNLAPAPPEAGRAPVSSHDELLVEASRRLEAGLRISDTVGQYSGPETLARITGDEFVLLLEDFKTRDDALKTAERVLHLLSRPFVLGGEETPVRVSLGVLVPEHAYDRPEELIRDANVAMYQAQQEGNGSAMVEFTPALRQSELARLQVKEDLRQAVKLGEFQVAYQPVYALEDGRLAGFEALARWQHPVRGVLPLAEFLAAAEETGLIVPLGQFVLREACRQLQAWLRQYPLDPDLFVSVNLSARQLAHPGLSGQVRDALAESGLEAKRLWLEVQEEALRRNQETAAPALQGLRHLGVRVAVDDFAPAGPDELRALESLPVDGIKLAAPAEEEQAACAALLRLGHDMGLYGFAIRVEREEEKAFFRSLGCEYGQGYLMGKPATAVEMEEVLEGSGVR